MSSRVAAAIAGLIMSAAAAAADTPASKGPCAAAPSHTPSADAAAPKGPEVGTKADGAGATGWTGATGGSTVGIDKKDGKEPSSPHPETATGLDPTKPGC